MFSKVEADLFASSRKHILLGELKNKNEHILSKIYQLRWVFIAVCLYIYICVCMCVCVCVKQTERDMNRDS